MDRDQRLFDEVVMPIYRRLYKEATPSADFDKLVESGEAKKERFFMNYALGMDRQYEIIKEVINEHKKRLRINKRTADRIRTTVMFGCSPCSKEVE